jgi:putative membrane protein
MNTTQYLALPVLTALASAAGSAQAAADQAAPGAYYGHPMWSGGWGHMFMGWGMMAVFMIALVFIVLFLIKGAAGGSQPSSSTALDILNERYARGEIDTAEYNERKKTISDAS